MLIGEHLVVLVILLTNAAMTVIVYICADSFRIHS